MTDNFLPDISVGDFAVDILKSMSKDPNGLKPALKESTVQSAGAPDVSKIKVSNDFVALVTEGKKPKQQIKTQVRESSEDRLTNLVERLSSLVTEARSIMEEITSGATTTGNIGINMAGKSRLANKLKNKLKFRR